MLATGIKTPVGIKLMGENLQILSDLGEQIEAVVREIPGTASAYSERVTGGNFLDSRSSGTRPPAMASRWMMFNPLSCPPSAA